MKIKPESIVIIFLICTCLTVCKYLYSNEKLLEHSRSFVTKNWLEPDVGSEDSLEEPKTNERNKNILTAINVEKLLLSEVPEIKEYEVYISEKSDNEACLLVEAVLEPRKIEGFSETYYAVYVGEQWETHAVNWDWFYVSSDLENILWYLLPEDIFMTLDEWRNSTYYRKLDD